MDPITHGLIGATTTLSVAGKPTLRPAACAGFISAMAADLDILITNPNDPLLNVEVHRTITHSLFFIPLGALVVSAFLWYFLRKRLTAPALYSYCFLGYATSGLADALTSYGTQLLWPFSDLRFSWNLISVFDPLFTLGILAITAYAFIQKRRSLAPLALLWMGLYLCFGNLQHQRSKQTAHKYAARNNHQIQQLIIKPTIANPFLWSFRYTTCDSLHSAAVHLSPFQGKQVYPGESTPLLNWTEAFSSFKGSKLYNDLQRFSNLSNGILVRHPERPMVVGDGRYSMLPTTNTPLWGVIADTTQPHRHLPFKNFRKITSANKTAFLKMILGKELRE